MWHKGCKRIKPFIAALVDGNKKYQNFFCGENLIQSMNAGQGWLILDTRQVRTIETQKAAKKKKIKITKNEKKKKRKKKK